ncbi:uroporphyrinogen decarboxylase family protein, partial [Xanthomonas phaseoli]|uniref:uroporphyrinogen decarboxylase family protein n=1 Tax=Xanthomonas phaseoli TaxID=1985254 RepID=UPI002368D802
PPLVWLGRGTGASVADLPASGAEAVGVDWTISLADAAQRAGGRVALQGNLDPATLYGSPEAIRSEVAKTLDSYAQGNGGSREGHVFNLGHGMSPDMNPEHVGVLVDAVQSLSKR